MKALSAILSLVTFHALGQGSLTPSGAPAPTMKTLQQIESRTPISSLPFAIINSGSYYVTTNLTGIAGTNGISVLADNVSIDLNGFTLTGVPGSSNGVWAATFVRNIAVRNGTLRNWVRKGADLGNALNAQMESLRASDNGSDGLLVGTGGIVTDCSAYANVGNGIAGFNGSLVEKSSAYNNSVAGIDVTFSSTIHNCSAYANGSNNIEAGAGSTITGCTANDSSGASGISTASRCHIAHCSAADNAQIGIGVNDGTTIRNCTVGNNAGDGIWVNSYCVVQENTCQGTTATNSAIRAFGSYNRIEANHAVFSYRALSIQGVGNVVIRNNVGNTTVANFFNAGNLVGPFINAAALATNTNPHANYSQ
jgi:hypothetical protein